MGTPGINNTTIAFRGHAVWHPTNYYCYIIIHLIMCYHKMPTLTVICRCLIIDTMTHKNPNISREMLLCAKTTRLQNIIDSYIHLWRCLKQIIIFFQELPSELEEKKIISILITTIGRRYQCDLAWPTVKQGIWWFQIYRVLIMFCHGRHDRHS